MNHVGINQSAVVGRKVSINELTNTAVFCTVVLRVLADSIYILRSTFQTLEFGLFPEFPLRSWTHLIVNSNYVEESDPPQL